MAGPYCGSRMTPRMTSRPPGFAMGDTVTPSIRARLSFCLTEANISS